VKYQLVLTSKFKRDLRLAKKRGLDIGLLNSVVSKLQNDMPLDSCYKDHALKGKYSGFRECHLQSDWLLVYLKEEDVLTLTLVETGTHSDLFDM